MLEKSWPREPEPPAAPPSATAAPHPLPSLPPVPAPAGNNQSQPPHGGTVRVSVIPANFTPPRCPRVSGCRVPPHLRAVPGLLPDPWPRLTPEAQPHTGGADLGTDSALPVGRSGEKCGTDLGPWVTRPPPRALGDPLGRRRREWEAAPENRLRLSPPPHPRPPLRPPLTAAWSPPSGPRHIGFRNTRFGALTRATAARSRVTHLRSLALRCISCFLLFNLSKSRSCIVNLREARTVPERSSPSMLSLHRLCPELD